MSMETVEKFGGDFGATVIFTFDAESPHHVDFIAAEIIEYGHNAATGAFGTPGYWRNGATSSMDSTDDLKNAARYFAGSVKWDGCSHIYFGDKNAYLHLCGVEHITKLGAILSAVYERCGEMMLAAGVTVLDDEFAVTRAKA